MTKPQHGREHRPRAPLIPAGTVRDTLRPRLSGDEAEARWSAQRRPEIGSSPLGLLSKAAAAGFLLGMVMPARAQTLVLASVVRAGVRKVLRSHDPPADGALEDTDRLVAESSINSDRFREAIASQATRRAALWHWM